MASNPDFDPNDPDNWCAHGSPRDAWCPHCKRDEKHGARWAKNEMKTDPGFRKAVFEVAKEHLVKQREVLLRKAVIAAMNDRSNIEPSIALNKGVWWDELAPLSPQERTIVLNQLRRQWNIQLN